MNEENGNGLSVENPVLGKLRARGSDVIASVVLAIAASTLIMLMQHKADAREDNKAWVEALRENTRAQREQIAAQREANCLARLTPEKRADQREVEFCRQLGRER